MTPLAIAQNEQITLDALPFHTIYDEDEVLIAYNFGTQTQYLNGEGIDNKLRSSSGSTANYFLGDHLGSTNGLANQSVNGECRFSLRLSLTFAAELAPKVERRIKSCRLCKMFFGEL